MDNLLTLIPSLTERPIQSVLSVALFLTIIRLTIHYFTTVRYPSNLPRVFEKPNATSFSWRTRLKYYVDAKSLQREAFEKFTKKGRTVLTPGLGFRDEVLLPHTSLKWLTSQPESVVSLTQGFAEMDQIEASFPHEKFIMDPWQGNLVRKDMNATLETVLEGLNDELGVAFDEYFGTDEGEWRDVRLYDTVQELIAQAAGRFTVGVPLCRNKPYLAVTNDFVLQFVVNAGLAGLFPVLLRPLIKALLFIPQRLRLRRIRHHLAPLYASRMSFLTTSPTEKMPDEPSDHLQLMLRYAQQYKPAELNLRDITCRIAVANLGSYHQTSMTATNLIFNIVASDPDYSTISLLREEFSTVLAANGGKWSKAAIAQMVRADSVCKETLRLQSFGGRALIRMVVKKGGVVMEDGVCVPKGAMVSIPSWAGQTDGDVFEKPFEFDPWRYSRVREAATSSQSSEGEGEKGKEREKTPPQTFVTTGVNFLPFGHGKHACPGRFLVDGELKMVLAYLVGNYDLKFPEEYKGVRPESKWLSEACFPPKEGRVLVRRRK